MYCAKKDTFKNKPLHNIDVSKKWKHHQHVHGCDKMGTKTVVETKKTIEFKSLPDFRRLLKPLALFLAFISLLIISYLISPSNLVVGVVTVLSFGVIGLFIHQSIYGFLLFRRYFY